MNIQTVFDTIHRIEELELKRQKTFTAEYDAFNSREINSFDRTRKLHHRLLVKLNELQDLLEEERRELEDFTEGTSQFRVEQAVRNRNQIIQKVQHHIKYSLEYHEAMTTAIKMLDENICKIENDREGEVKDTQTQFKQAQQAIEHHNEKIEDLDKNLSVMNAYLR